MSPAGRGSGGGPGIPGAVWLVAAVAAWIGATVLFAAVVAPALFTLLPSPALAGRVVGRTLGVLFVCGMVVGALAVGLALAALPGARRRVACAAGGAGAAVSCAVAHFLVGGRIRRVRVAIGPSLDALAPGDPLRAEFGRLHGVSVGLLAVAALAALVVLLAAGRSAGRPAGTNL